MPPIVATLVTALFIFYLFRRDFRQHPNLTRALWLPFIWMVLCGSRAVSEWLSLGGLDYGAATLEEGSPLDRLVYLGLIVAGFYVLHQRQVRLGQLIRDNRWLAAFLIYCLLAVLWSDYPFVSLKRWIKVIGHPIMVLIILTEPDPETALKAVMKRAAFILLPISILFIKYYPQWGRGFSVWTGEAYNTGITSNKNLLGADCFILGFFFIWYFLSTWREPRTKARRNELIFCTAFLYMIWWLNSMARSQTSLVALIVGTLVLLFTGLRLVNKRLLGAYIIAGVAFIAVVQMTFGVYAKTLELLGRDPTLTDRTLLWADLLKADINPALGAGFESFWLGERLKTIWETWTFRPNQAHNGYIETYLNLGLIGVFLLVALLIATYGKARRELLRNYEFGRFRLGYLAAAIVYNWTEAGFKTTHFVFFAFYIIAIDYSWRPTDSSELLFESPSADEKENLVYAHPQRG